MLYHLENDELTECMTCEHSYYKLKTSTRKTPVTYKKLRYFSITPRLQRLFMSLRTGKQMTWHQSHDTVDGVMMHPSNSKAWKHFNSVHPYFSAKTRNMHIGLCTNIFKPFWSFASWDVYEAKVHIFIYGYTRSGSEYGCLSLTIVW